MADFRDEHSKNLKKLHGSDGFKTTIGSSNNSPEFKRGGSGSSAKRKGSTHNTKISTPTFGKKPSKAKNVKKTVADLSSKQLPKKSGNGGKIAIFVFFGIIILLIVFTLVGPHISNGVKTGYVQNGIIEKSVEGQAVFVRDELTVASDFTGKVIPAINEGEKVSKDEVVAYIVDDKHQEIVEELKRIEDRIVSAQTFNDDVSGSVVSGLNETNSAVRAQIYSLTPSIAKGSLRGFSQVNSEIASFFNMQNDLTMSVETKEEYIKLLQDQREGILNDLKGHMYALTAPEAGVVSYCLDGNENKVSEMKHENITLSSIDGLSENAEKTTGRTVKKGEKVFRITTDSDYYIAVTVPKKQGEKIRSGDSVIVQALDHSFKANATVESVSGNEDELLVVLKSSSNMSTTISYRIQDVSIIYESVSGMKLPLRALTDWDSAKLTAKVKVIRSNTVYEVYVRVISYNDEYAVVTNQTAFENLSEATGLKANDMYVHNPDKVSEGELVE